MIILLDTLLHYWTCFSGTAYFTLSPTPAPNICIAVPLYKENCTRLRHFSLKLKLTLIKANKPPALVMFLFSALYEVFLNITYL